MDEGGSSECGGLVVANGMLVGIAMLKSHLRITDAQIGIQDVGEFDLEIPHIGSIGVNYQLWCVAC